MSDKMLRAAIYIRVSTAEQYMHGKSLGAQQECLRKYAEDNNMVVAGVYADEGHSARKELKKRKAIHVLLNDVEAGKIDIILFWRMDRWFRNLSDFYKVQDILDKYKVRWISVSEPNINIETRDGRLQLNVVLSIGQNESDTTSERITFVNDVSVDQGKLIFGEANMGFGYKSAVINGEKRMVKDEKTEAMVNDCFRYYRIHQSKSATIKYMNETYGIPFSNSMLRTLLNSKFYMGMYRNNRNYCPAYLTEEEWYEIQEIQKKNVKHARSGRIYLFTSLIRCPKCGQILVGSGCSSIINRKTGEKRTYCYFRCNRALLDKICTYRHRLSQNLIEKYLLDNLETEYNKYKVRCNTLYEKKPVTKKTRSPEKINSEIERLNIMFQKERISWEYYDKEYAKLQAELTSVSIPQKKETRDLSHLDNLFKKDFVKMYESLDLENRRSFWRSIIKEIFIDEDGNIIQIDFL